MTTLTAPGASSQPTAPAPEAAAPKTSAAARVAAFTGHWAVRFALVVIGLFWLMPTAGCSVRHCATRRMSPYPAGGTSST